MPADCPGPRALGSSACGARSVLFGATSVEQLRANCAAISLLDSLGQTGLAQLRRIGLTTEQEA